MKDMPRFREPSRQDDRARCQQCQREFHYEELSETGLCPDCKPDDEDERHEEISKSHLQVSAPRTF